LPALAHVLVLRNSQHLVFFQRLYEETNMDLHRAVGQLITGKVFGGDLDQTTANLIAAGTISGITLFKANGQNLRQLAELVNNLHQVGGNGFIVSVDQEGGAVQRFEHLIAPMPSAMALAALNDLEKVRAVATMQAYHLFLLGINCNFVPALDVNSNPLNPIIATRSFGDNPDTIAKFGLEMANTYLDHGVLPVGKHFPGHGDTAQDTHLQMVSVGADRETLNRRELRPFVACAPALPAIMVSHIWLKALDEQAVPASLSRNVVTGLLREELGYDGFVVTDDMPAMKAIVDHWGLEDAAIMAINAGIDHILMCGTAEQVSSVHAALLAAVEKGTVSEKRVSEAIERRVRAESRCRTAFDTASRGRPAWPMQQSLEQRLEAIEKSLERARELCRDTSSAAIYSARGSVPDLSTNMGEWVLVVPDHQRYRMNILTALSGYLKPGQAAIHERRYSLDPSADEIADVMVFASGKKCIFLSYRSLINEGQLRLARKLIDYVDASSLLVATDVPYDLAVLPEWKNAVALFDPSDQGMDGLAKILAGGAIPQGTCPVGLDLQRA
jgi:beta-N-acetylhexosaminidase